jgi:hypothetical protein
MNNNVYVNNLTVNNLTTGNCILSNIFNNISGSVMIVTGLNITSLTTGSLVVTNAFVNSTKSDYSITNATMTDLVVNNAILTNATMTNLNTSGITMTNLFCTNTTDYGFTAQSNASMAILALTETIVTSTYWNGTNPITLGGISYSNGIYTVTNPGVYKVVASMFTTSASNNINAWISIVRLGTSHRFGITTFPANYRIQVSANVLCQANDQIRVAVYSNASFTLNACGAGYALSYSIKKLS